ncbi:hypothetical protein SLA2020_360450 [Shorea laevis]
MSGTGGVLRDEYGNWIVGFAKNLGHGSNNAAEFWGIKTGLRIALERGFTKVEVKSDSLFAVSTLNNKYVANRSHSSIVTLCRSLIRWFEKIVLQHAFREANEFTHTLAKHGTIMEEPSVVYDFVPFSVLSFFFVPYVIFFLCFLFLL